MQIQTISGRVLLAAMLAAGVAACHRAAPPPAPFAWAFDNHPIKPPAKPPADETFAVPGSSARLTAAQVRDRYALADWFPGDHPPMPTPVGHAQAPTFASCGYCHLPSGDGRPENASIAGLPKDYIVAQVRAFRNGSRRSAVPDYGPTGYMTKVSQAVPDGEVAQAAAYFSTLPRHNRTRVIEAATIPAVENGGFVLRLKPGGGIVPLGKRIVEVPDDFERFELRDPRMTFRAYVPPGSVALGRQLAASWGDKGSLACATCHGADLRGLGVIPPLAGRSPGYIVRQLANFQRGSRSAPEDAPMRQVTARMTEDDAIALAAYLATLKV